MKFIIYLMLVLLPFSVVAQTPWQMKQAPLMTSFSNDIDPANVLPEYPRPQMVREQWQNLNGIWQYQPAYSISESTPAGNLAHEVLVPFAIESAISGIMEYHEYLWYKKSFTVPTDWNGQRIKLHFGAVDYLCKVIVNGTTVGTHQGGYDSFAFDITDALTASGDQELAVLVYDPTDSKGFPRGKQTLYPGGIMYTSVTGIWQTVWLEPVPDTNIQTIKMVPDIDQSVLNLTVNTEGVATGVTVTAVVKDGETTVSTQTANANESFNISVPNAKLWSPTDPFLYDIDITIEKDGAVLDQIGSYFGMRKIAMVEEEGIQKLYLNNAFLFHLGPLDQGFWPDGLYTAPTDEALKSDIEKIKAYGFNMVRKHIKVEPQRWYYWADKLGVMVWQDMPSMNSYTSNPQPREDAAFETELIQMVEEHWNSPSIVMWVVFNEYQGQHDVTNLVNMVMQMDPTRMVNQGSGGPFENAGHILDYHAYPPPTAPESSTQVRACGEFGGIGYNIDGHLWDPSRLMEYITVDNEEEYLSTYEEYMDQLTVYKTNNGLSAGVYTEITDVEIELNGLMTYDRLDKAEMSRIFAANQKVINNNIYIYELVPSSEKSPQVWKYRTDQPATTWYQTTYTDSHWSTGNGGFGTYGTPGAVIGTEWNTNNIWMRRQFELGDLSSVNMDDVYLYIHHDEACEVYINGVLATSLTGYTTKYITVPISAEAKAALIENGTNLIAVHCNQTAGGQFMDVGLSLRSLDYQYPTAINNHKILNDLNLYPNPVEDTMTISKELSSDAYASIINLKGEEMQQIKGQIDHVDVSGLKTGLYVLKVNDGGIVQNIKFYKK
ncbi:sugar-binding domain-containing protein [Carboxylicivirga caseinilyticus]|uniref:sugar-binding domain-containing protein n=1 Tax=Carboxylicivirga caseinilyticus TaxID=3417572 RepID=UPI003D35772F|nr:T9SS type A sorting domain-containing protein [Marinilabiliaceae bacterium A049]